MKHFKVKLSDHSTRIVDENELREWEQMAEEYDGFQAWSVLAEVEPPSLIDKVMAWATIPDRDDRRMFLAETAKVVS